MVDTHDTYDAHEHAKAKLVKYDIIYGMTAETWLQRLDSRDLAKSHTKTSLAPTALWIAGVSVLLSAAAGKRQEQSTPQGMIDGRPWIDQRCPIPLKKGFMPPASCRYRSWARGASKSQDSDVWHHLWLDCMGPGEGTGRVGHLCGSGSEPHQLFPTALLRGMPPLLRLSGLPTRPLSPLPPPHPSLLKPV